MKVWITALILIWVQTAFAQEDISLSLKRSNQGYSYENYPFPDNIMVFALDKSKHILKSEGLTLIRVWSIRDGLRPALWDRARKIEQTYKAAGLTTYSINFENGTDFRKQKRKLEEFFKTVAPPEHFYFDAMGYTIDLLKVPGFPAYFLVDPQGQVVFKTLAEDLTGVKLLEQQIRSYLKKK